MRCNLCENSIKDYNSSFNQLQINELHSVDICQECIDKFVKWQQNNYAQLFPTKTAKKRLQKRNSL